MCTQFSTCPGEREADLRSWCFRPTIKRRWWRDEDGGHELLGKDLPWEPASPSLGGRAPQPPFEGAGEKAPRSQDRPGRPSRASASPAGPLGREEEVAPLAGPSLPPSARGPGHVHPHVAHTDQLPQHQADGRHVTRPSPCSLIAPPSGQLPYRHGVGAPFPGFTLPPSGSGPGGGGREGSDQLASPAAGKTCVARSARDPQEPGLVGPRVSVQREQRDVTGTAPNRRAGHRSSGICPTVGPSADEETEAQSQEAPAQVT